MVDTGDCRRRADPGLRIWDAFGACASAPLIGHRYGNPYVCSFGLRRTCLFRGSVALAARQVPFLRKKELIIRIAYYPSSVHTNAVVLLYSNVVYS